MTETILKIFDRTGFFMSIGTTLPFFIFYPVIIFMGSYMGKSLDTVVNMSISIFIIQSLAFILGLIISLFARDLK